MFRILPIICFAFLIVIGSTTLPVIAGESITVQQDLPPGEDEDGDGELNGKDRCPYQPGPRDNYGCPTGDDDPAETPEPSEPSETDEPSFPIPDDSDGDGTADPQDLCPMIPGNGLYQGCVDRDQDNDGLLNVNDECPVEVGSLENDGCPNESSDTVVTPVLPALPLDGCAIATQTTDGVFVRSEPTTSVDNVIDVLEPTQVYTGTQRRSDNSWFYIDSLDGWVASRVVRSTSECENLPLDGNTQVLSLTPPDSNNSSMRWYCVTVSESYRWTPLQSPRPYPASQATDHTWDTIEGRLILEYGGQPVDATPTRDYGTGSLAYVPRPARPMVGFVRGWNKSQVASQTLLIASGYVEYRGLIGEQGDSYEGAIPNAPIEVYGPGDTWSEACGANPTNSTQASDRQLHCVVAESEYMWTADLSESPASEANEHAWDNVVMYLSLYDDRRLLATSGLISDTTAPFTISLSNPLTGHVMAVNKQAANLRTDLRVNGFVSYDSGAFEIDEDEFDGWLNADLTVYGPNDTWPEHCGNNPYQINIEDLLPVFQIDVTLIPSLFSTQETCYYYIGSYRNTSSSTAQVSVWFTSNISSTPLSGTYTRTIAPGETDRILIADAVELVNFLEFRIRTHYADGIEILDTTFDTQAMQYCDNNRIYDGQQADNPN